MRVNLSIPEELYQKARNFVEDGRGNNLSAFICDLLIGYFQSDKTFTPTKEEVQIQTSEIPKPKLDELKELVKKVERDNRPTKPKRGPCIHGRVEGEYCGRCL